MVPPSFPYHFEHLPAELVLEQDPDSGLTVRRLTDAIGHSQSLYFTVEPWALADTLLVFASERTGTLELWGCDLRDYSLVRLSHRAGANPRGQPFLGACLDPTRTCVAYWQDGTLVITDLRTGALRCVLAGEPRFRGHGLSWTADGKWILTSLSDAGPTGVPANTEQRLRWLRQPPRSRIVAVAADGSGRRILHEEDWLITHVNASPMDPDLCTFCHEGPWLEVDQRIWGLRVSGGVPWKIVHRDPAWGVGHEFWLADGRTVGFHARHAGDPWRHAAGFADVLTGEVWQAELALPTHHAIAVSRDFMVLDGTRATGDYLLVVDRDGDRWGPPRLLARHDTSRHHQASHAHPRLRADGRQLVFTSDRRSYCDVYLLDLPLDRLALPLWPGKPYRYYWE